MFTCYSQSVIHHSASRWPAWRPLRGIAIGVLTLGPFAIAADERSTGGGLTVSTTDEELVSLIAELGDPSYEVRTAATRRLCAIGMPARARLRKAAEGDDVETALRAKNLLAVLDQIQFAGLDVLLSFSKSSIAWNESVDLRVTLINDSAYSGRVPFETDPGRRAERRKWSVNALQVGDMLDLAELITVRGPDGREIDLRVDDILADPRVEVAVRERLDIGPMGVIDAGKSVALTLNAFNRGWARYPLLDRGRYDIVLDYVPPWEDELLKTQRVGRVVSNPATITVTAGAPDTVSRGGEEASLRIERNAESLVAVLINRTDQPVLVNKNFGLAAPFAQGRWVYTLNDSIVDVPVLPKRRVSWDDFDQTLLVEVPPGGSLEVVRGDLKVIHQALAAAGADLSGTEWTVHFSYSNLCNRRWQERQGARLRDDPKVPQVLQEPLPPRMLSTRQTSNLLRAPKTE